MHGIGKDRPTGFWRQLAEHLVQNQQLATTADDYRSAMLTPQSKAVLKGEERVLLPRSRAASAFTGGGGGGGGGPGRAGAGRGEESGPPMDAGLFQRLRDLRREIAAEQGVPPYVVFGDLTLRQMARQLPSSESDLIHISGVGQTKLERYGPKFLEAIREHAAAAAK